MGDIVCDIITTENVYCVFVRFIDTTDSKITSIKTRSVTKDHHNKKVTHIVFYKCILSNFPSELGELFPNLKYIDIFDCQLEKITKYDLKSLPKLEKIKAESNLLNFLPFDLFEFSPHIKLVNFCDNFIDKIGASIFDNCKHLYKVDLRNNRGIDMCYKKNQMDLKEIRNKIVKSCAPIKTLRKLAEKVVIETMQDKNVEEIVQIAKYCKFVKLSDVAEKRLLYIQRVEKFLNYL
ncbi:hypothetical protein PVAND_016407 [Polypedilum vanderplanki]|uniref:Leucine rich repeat protein n=1 Tax=Polypedilum vanderplanki TaxID=319348 RepID=A0A9J6BG47_POLVA|nr:hypothetical protein PVAND_016407 [Polypedilum vanderplanki]